MIECPRCGEQGEGEHECPFRADVYDDRDFKCTCCDECTDECAMDI